MGTLKNVENFRFWCHKIIPLVYDESLSYYEFLCKVMAKLNEVIDTLDAQNEHIVEFETEVRELITEVQTVIEREITDVKNGIAHEWEANKHYKYGDYVWHETNIVKCIEEHTSGEAFDAQYWSDMPYSEYITEVVTGIEQDITDIQADIRRIDNTEIPALGDNKSDKFRDPLEYNIAGASNISFNTGNASYNLYEVAIPEEFVRLNGHSFVVEMTGITNIIGVAIKDAPENVTLQDISSISQPQLTDTVLWNFGVAKITDDATNKLYIVGDHSEGTSSATGVSVHYTKTIAPQMNETMAVFPSSVLYNDAIQNIAKLSGNVVHSSAVRHIVQMTQAEYDLITPSSDTMYVIVG